ncbi:hypothetical protein Clacol_002687 [Clathrus columnatus]|uniref:Uncharacterized protein n=1 Tax=Clathrus columnatus TaxID=1419009 RepID=A0AAV5A6V3_9AGAM|nr:hypothetical protein Clacol_002687 [Clathrus columnatus]
MGVATRTRKRAREAAFHLLPALQDPRDRKKFKAELSPELSQTFPITRSPTHTVSLQTNIINNKSPHGLTLNQNSVLSPSPHVSRNPIEVIDLTVDRNTNQSITHLSSNTRVTRSASRRAQLQAKLAQDSSTQQSGFSGNAQSTGASKVQSNPQYDTDISVSTPSSLPYLSSIISSPNKSTENVLGNSVCDSQPPNPNTATYNDDMDVDLNQCTQQRILPISNNDATKKEAIQQQKPALSGTLEYMSPRNSGAEVFPSCNSSPSEVINTSGSEDHTVLKTFRRFKTPPSSYLAPNPVRRAPRISSAKRDTARYLLEATEKAALLAYRETRREFPRWMSNPSRTFFRGSTYIPRGLPIRYPEDNSVPMSLGTTVDLGSGASHFTSTDAFTLQSSPSSFQTSHVQLDPDLDPSPLLDRTSLRMPLLNDSLGAVSSLSLLPLPSDLVSLSAPPTAMYLRTKRGLWYNYAVSVQHANQISSASSCGFTQNDNVDLMPFENDISIPPLTVNEECMYDSNKDSLDWMVPPYYSVSRENMQSTSSYGDSSLGVMNSYFKSADLLPLLEPPCMTTSNFLTEWNMDCTA